MLKKKGRVKKSFIVLNEKGLHTRPATELVKLATTFRADIKLAFSDLTVNAKSLLGILMLAASRGSKIRIEAEGEDADEATEAILELSRNKFNIKY